MTDVHYVMDVGATTRADQLIVQIYRLTQGNDGRSKQLVAAPADPRALDSVVASSDREILSRFFGAATTSIVRVGQWSEDVVPLRLRVNAFSVADSIRTELLERMAKTGRFGWLNVVDDGQEGSGPYDLEHFKPLHWDVVEPWGFGISAQSARQGQAWILRGDFRRAGDVVPVQECLLL
ncbi:hypothetical protein E3A20_30460 [Planctomyces bekefii]|uniref:Uncharacterized protein n=1 Tax=Planctomyces bekefii TaxID=1653850 RepID=A0A5C6M100_9PLAN|nr:hypothetical protein E3A20_30460 [Planctomyces bekefii]